MPSSTYDIVVIGSGLGGLTAANRLARAGYRVLLAEQHTQIGGLATWFRRKSHIFDVALHGFPVGMKKSLRKYWGQRFADQIIQVRSVRFDNPQYHLESVFDTRDFTAKLIGHFGIPEATVRAFFEGVAEMNHYDDQSLTTRQFFSRFFPGRTDVWRFLMEPITYANGSTLDEPALTYGIVFGNFMSEGVYTFLGGTDLMLRMMDEELRRNGVEIRLGAPAERILCGPRGVEGVQIGGHAVACRAVVSNGSLLRTVNELAGPEHFSAEFREALAKVRLSTSSCQVYIGIKPGERLPYLGELLFESTCPEYDAEALVSHHVTSRTFSFYYPEIRPGSTQYAVVASMNARHADWAALAPEQYRAEKARMTEETIASLERRIPNLRQIIDYTCAATPRTFERYTGHLQGATFGTKFEGLDCSRRLPRELPGLFHTGSVGIIMSGWLGAVNYGVITANAVDQFLCQQP